MTARIRPALPSDADGVLDLIQQHAAFEQATARITRAMLAGILADESPPTRIFVAGSCGKLVDCAA